MGVWIETLWNFGHIDSKQSHPVWVCGLKPRYAEYKTHIDESHPVWVCGLKLRKTILTPIRRRHTLYGCVD